MMLKHNYQSKIYIWSYIYVLIVLIFSRFINTYNLAIWGLYLVLALPFYAHLDKYAIICFIFSTLSDYFSGVGEGIMGLHSILIILAIINIFVERNAKLSIRGMLWPFLLIISFWLSFLHSPFHYINGAYSMTYVVIVSMVIMGTIRTDDDTLSDYLPVLSSFIIVYFLLVLVLDGNYSLSMLTIRQDINHNSFGRCLAQFSTIFAVKVLISEQKSKQYRIIWGITILLTLLTGSRNALFAEIATIVFVYIFVQKRKGNIITKVAKVFASISAALLIGNLFLPDVGLLAERYYISTLIATGGTNRTTIWSKLIPLLIKDYTWFGYGPGYYCSAQVVTSLVNRAYTNTHNIILEAWGQVGLIGLICFLGIVVKSTRNAVEYSKRNINLLFIIALLVDCFVNGIGEAMFAGTNLWIIIGLCYSFRYKSKDSVEEDYEYPNKLKKTISGYI